MKYQKLFLLFYLIIGFIPNIGASDVNSAQSFYISVLNAIVFLFLIINKSSRKPFFESIRYNYFFISLLLFLIWSFITSFFAVNQVESFRVMSEFTPLMLATIPINYFLNTEKSKNLNWILSLIPILLSLEIAAVLLPYFRDLFQSTYISRSARYSGITGNINIAAFSIVIKLPFIWYHMLKKENNLWIKLFSIFIYISGLYAIISVHETRGAILSIFLLILFSCIFYLLRSLLNNTRLPFTKFLALLIPFFLVISINYYQGIKIQKSNVFDRLETIQTFNDSSSMERLRFYKQAISSILENPFLGVGIGNWSLESVKRDLDFISNYVVAYHVHNDFLEIFASTGILGFLFFFGFIFLCIFLLIKKILDSKLDPSVDIHFIILLSIAGYMMDSFLNFPFSRPIQLMQLFICVLILKYLINAKNSFYKVKMSSGLIILILFFLIPLNIYSSGRLYKSNREQFILLGQFNANKLIEPLENVLNFEEDFPNLSGTTIPLSTFKGMYLNENRKYNEAIPYFKKGMIENPYLPVSEAFLGWAYLNLNKLDSALYYTSKAFNKSSNNSIHYAYYMSSLALLKDTLSIEKVYNKMKTISKEEFVDNVYYVSLSTVLGKSNSDEIVSKANKRLLETKDQAAIRGIYFLNFGEENTLKALEAHKIGLKYFENKQYESAAILFEKAAELNNLEAPYFENAANANLKIGNIDKAIFYLDNVLKKLNPKSPKANYLKALILIKNEELDKACDLLLIANKNGHPNAMSVFTYYCK